MIIVFVHFKEKVFCVLRCKCMSPFQKSTSTSHERDASCRLLCRLLSYRVSYSQNDSIKRWREWATDRQCGEIHCRYHCVLWFRCCSVFREWNEREIYKMMMSEVSQRELLRNISTTHTERMEQRDGPVVWQSWIQISTELGTLHTMDAICSFRNFRIETYAKCTFIRKKKMEKEKKKLDNLSI